jgi:Asp-tRNA(Asn)/Glu-tRNA(Gln) amidotransferase A subunit family amidase
LTAFVLTNDTDSPELYANAPICLQILGQKFTEEEILACLRVIEASLMVSKQEERNQDV